jgi:hypothetical protein
MLSWDWVCHVAWGVSGQTSVSDEHVVARLFSGDSPGSLPWVKSLQFKGLEQAAP